MISVLSGDVLQVGRDSAVIDVNGVGFDVALVESHAVTLKVGDRVTLYTLFIKRPESMSLWGFAGKNELELFVTVMETPGVGVKIARAALGMLGYDGLVDAIRHGNEPALRKIPGVGPRAAAMLLVALRPKLGTAPESSEPGPVNSRGGRGARSSLRRQASPGQADAVAGLQSLGVTKRDAVKVVDDVMPALGENAGVQEILRAALAAMGPRT